MPTPVMSVQHCLVKKWSRISFFVGGRTNKTFQRQSMNCEGLVLNMRRKRTSFQQAVVLSGATSVARIQLLIISSDLSNETPKIMSTPSELHLPKNCLAAGSSPVQRCTLPPFQGSQPIHLHSSGPESQWPAQNVLPSVS